MALPSPDSDKLDMLEESQNLGRLSALSMLMYFLVGPYVNIYMYHHSVLASLAVPLLGILLMLLVIFIPKFFKAWSAIFAAYSLIVLSLTV